MKYFSNKKGFSLIELLVVIAIIGILTAIVTANLTQSKAKARDANRVSDITQMQLTLEMIFDRCNIYPPNITDTTTAVCTKSGIAYPISYFISKVPTDPSTKAPYDYLPLSSNTDFIIGTQLEMGSGAMQDSASGTLDTHTCGTANYYCVVPK